MFGPTTVRLIGRWQDRAFSRRELVEAAGDRGLRDDQRHTALIVYGR